MGCIRDRGRRTGRACDTDKIGVTSLIQARGLPAAVVAIGFAVMARAMGAVTDGGALAGVLVALGPDAGRRFRRLRPLATVFLLTAITTRWGYARKQTLGVAERGRGRTASQVFANLWAAALCALPVIWFPQFSDVLLLAAMAALAEAAADTVSSEVGQATANSAYMITDFRAAAIGTNGAISVEGTLSGCIAASIVAWVSAYFGIVPWHVDAGRRHRRNRGHVSRQRSGRDLGERRQDGQRLGELCEHGVRRRPRAGGGDGGGEDWH